MSKQKKLTVKDVVLYLEAEIEALENHIKMMESDPLYEEEWSDFGMEETGLDEDKFRLQIMKYLLACQYKRHEQLISNTIH